MAAPQTIVNDQYHSTARDNNPQPREVLEELFLLLEEFGPNWYTEEHHKRAMAALEIQ